MPLVACVSSFLDTLTLDKFNQTISNGLINQQIPQSVSGVDTEKKVIFYRYYLLHGPNLLLIYYIQ